MMNVEERIAGYIAAQPVHKAADMQHLHNSILSSFPNVKLSYLDGKDDSGKVVSNPNIGYGEVLLRNANGHERGFYAVGMSANTTGISIYFMGLKEKDALQLLLGNTLGNAKVTGYCVKFKRLSEVNVDVLLNAIRFRLTESAG